MAKSKPQHPAELLPTLTAQEARIYMATADGKKHSPKDLAKAVLWDEKGSVKNLQKAICLLRKKLRPLGEDIVTQLSHRRTWVRRVKLLNGAESAE